MHALLGPTGSARPDLMHAPNGLSMFLRRSADPRYPPSGGRADLGTQSLGYLVTRGALDLSF